MNDERQDLPMAKELLDAMLNNIYLGFTVIDKDGVVRFRNQVSEDHSGIRNDDVLNSPYSNINKEGRLLQVLRTGVPEFGATYTTPEGDSKIINRLPLISGNRVIGAMTVGFSEKTVIPKKYGIMEEKIKYYEKELRVLRQAKYDLHSIIGKSESVANIKKLILRYSQASAPVLITGPTGTGKEQCAHAVHLNSERRNGAFVKVNCASIPHDLFESELFGYESGAFTGASKKGKAGKLELANHGSIFLDEITSLPLETQPKLLRVLQEKEIERIGGNRVSTLDVRFIFATNEDLESMVRQGRFREDLYYRIKILTLDLPSLAKRKEDIPLLAEHFIRTFNQEGHVSINGISSKAMEILFRWNWPGNVRELRNVLETAAYLNESGTISPGDLPTYLTGSAGDEKANALTEVSNCPLKKARKDFEHDIIETELIRCNWNKSKAAKQMGISRPLLYSLLKRYGIQRDN
jgi:transcriptional regulator with PAS, ATPase and Fis domain